MKSNIELEGLSLLNQTRSSLKKSLFRNIIRHVQRRIQKDFNSISSEHIFLILLNETKAVHRILDQAIIDRLKEKPNILVKLISIMNRNLRVCLSLLTDKLEEFIIYLDYPSAKGRTFTPEESMVNFCHQIEAFFSVLLKSYSYFYALNRPQVRTQNCMKQICDECKFILEFFIDCKSKNAQHNLAISETILLIMSICILESQYEEAEFYFEKASVFILAALRIAYLRKAQKSKYELKQINQLKEMLLICLINNQRMLVIGQGKLAGWDFGFGVIKMLQTYLGSRSVWNKYIKIQYQIKHMMELAKLTQLKQLCIDLLAQHLQPIQRQLKYCKNSVNLVNCRQIKMFQERSNFKQVNAKKHNSQKSTFYFNTHKNSNFGENDKIKKGFARQIKRNKFANHDSFYSFMNLSDDKAQNNNTVFTKSQRKQPPPFLLKQQKKQNLIKRNKLIESNSNRKGAQIYKILNYKTKDAKNSKRLKKIPLGTNSLINLSNKQLNACQQFSIALQKQAIKAKSKDKLLHRLISNDGYQYTNPKEIKPYWEKPRESNSRVKSLACQQEEIHSSIMDKLIHILLLNKKKIGIRLLSQKYELTMKRKKIRNYQSQLIQFDIQKQLNILISTTTIMPKKQQNKQFKSACNLKSLLETIQSCNSINKFSKKQKEKSEIQIQNSFNKSKYSIGEMLKKVSISSFSKTMRNNQQIVKKVNHSFY